MDPRMTARIEATATIPGYTLKLIAPWGARNPAAVARALACALTAGRYLRNDVLDFSREGYLVRSMSDRQMSVYVQKGSV